MTPAKALFLAGIATSVPLAALSAELPRAAGFGSSDAPPPPGDDAACADATSSPRVVWTTCATRGDFEAGNLTVSGRADVAGTLRASEVSADTLVAAAAVRAQSAALSGALEASSAAIAGPVRAADLDVDGRAVVGVLELRAAVSPVPACVEGALALVRNADGSDSLEACLRTPQAALAWSAVATGGSPASTTQPRGS